MIEFLPFVLYAALMAVTPGPNNVMLAASGLNHGFSRTLPHMLGIFSGHMLQLFVTCLGLGEIFLAFPIMQTTLRVVGCLYLLYLSYKILGSKFDSKRLREGRPIHFLEALLFQFVNPKAWVFVTTVAALFLPKDSASLLLTALIMSLCSGVVTLFCITLWAGSGHALRRFLGNPVVMRVFNSVTALALVGTAVYLLL